MSILSICVLAAVAVILLVYTYIALRFRVPPASAQIPRWVPASAAEEDRPTRHLSVLRWQLDDCAALILESLHVTHRDVLQLHDVSEGYQLGIRAVSGDFTHTPSGRRYLVAITAIPREADPSPQLDLPITAGLSEWANERLFNERKGELERQA